MHEARLGADDLGEVGQEGDNVVLDLALDGIDPRDVERRAAALLPELGRRLPWDDAQLRHRVESVRLDFEPDSELRLRRPDAGHLRTAVARDQSLLPLVRARGARRA